MFKQKFLMPYNPIAWRKIFHHLGDKSQNQSLRFQCDQIIFSNKCIQSWYFEGILMMEIMTLISSHINLGSKHETQDGLYFRWQFLQPVRTWQNCVKIMSNIDEFYIWLQYAWTMRNSIIRNKAWGWVVWTFCWICINYKTISSWILFMVLLTP